MAVTQLKSPEAAARWLQEWCTGALRTDSRAVQAGDAFIAWPGYARDGRDFALQALAAGAATVLVEAEGVESFAFADARIATLHGLKRHTGAIAAAVLGQPSQVLDVVAVTGTNGKTSTAWWTAQALTLAGRGCGLVGTLGVGTPPIPGGVKGVTGATGATGATGSIAYTGLTTPDPVRLQQGFADMRAAGLSACAIEASSIGIEEHRLAGTRIRVAQFTNFTQDHLDYHGDMAAYWQAKRKLFSWPGLEAVVLNVDDPQGAALAKELTGLLDVWTVGLGAAHLRASGVHYTAQGLAFDVHEGGQGGLAETHTVPVQTTLIGDYNVHNWLGVLGALRALGVGLADAVAACAPVTPVPGRMQRIGHGRELPLVVVDYAHTPDALDKALSALKPLTAARGGRLHAVFGCGGDRDRAKRPQMGAIAARVADAVLLTSDNPRTEDPAQILADILAGAGAGVRCEPDRALAIAAAVQGAAAADVVVIAGKGHEDYQEVMGVRHPFDDATRARAALIERAGL